MHVSLKRINSMVINLYFNFVVNQGDTLPTPWWDSNVNPELKTTEGKGVGARSLARNTIEGYRGMLELRDGNRKKWQAHSLTRTCTKPTQSG
jgi:hypothetical protein